MGSAKFKKFFFGTKAETLRSLSQLYAGFKIPDFYIFTVSQWKDQHSLILAEIQNKFSGQKLAIRSSALIEDGSSHSYAGAFDSRLNVSCQDKELKTAIDQVISSYNEDLNNQVLVQPMVENIAVSGVATNYALEDGAPYYVFNYDDESGRPDSITGGTGVSKCVYIHHDAKVEMFDSSRLLSWLELFKNIESVCGHIGLDVEYAEDTNGQLYVLQVRRLVNYNKWDRSEHKRLKLTAKDIEAQFSNLAKGKQHLYGSSNVLGTMPDWNPAEIIGPNPRPLSLSLYQVLITDSVWREARKEMGYKNPEGEKLMVDICGRPYIDVRNSFNSFIPKFLPDHISQKLVDAWLERLKMCPEFHDKVEFEIVNTAYDFSFEEKFNKRYPGLLSAGELTQYKNQLLQLTLENLELGKASSLSSNEAKILELANKQEFYPEYQTFRNFSQHEIHQHLHKLIDEVKELGTLPFAVLARHAFIAESLLRSLVEQAALKAERLSQFKRSIVTVAGQMMSDFQNACAEPDKRSYFLKKYGHLRPGTYDILSTRYDQKQHLFSGSKKLLLEEQSFTLSPSEESAINQLCSQHGFSSFKAQDLLDYAARAIALREHAKFVFTRNISDLLEAIAAWGEHKSLNHEQLSHLRIEQILPQKEISNEFLKSAINANIKQSSFQSRLKLGYLIRSVDDIYVVPIHRSAANFISSQNVEGEIVALKNTDAEDINIENKIVCIENADPGFDWIFTRNIKGLITKFGGSNSHMAIRCSEFGLPAAIGCGKLLFDNLLKAGFVELNCQDQIVRPLHE